MSQGLYSGTDDSGDSVLAGGVFCLPEPSFIIWRDTYGCQDLPLSPLALGLEAGAHTGAHEGCGPTTAGAQSRTFFQEAFGLEEEMSLVALEVLFI